jgi:aminocarboxymuconate-semialdehyde decarboxylase
METPLKIDIHTHILPERWPDLRERYGYGGFIRLDHHKPCCARMMMDDKFFREVESNCWDPQARMQEGDLVECHVQVLSTVPVMFSYWAQARHALDLSKLLNDHIAGVCHDFPKRFVGLGTLPLQAPDLAVQELERCKSIGLKGIQIGSHINEWNLNAPELFAVFSAAQDLDMAVFVHPWDMMGTAKMQQYWLPWLVGMPAEGSLAICSMIFGGVFERLPRLRVAFAHGGGSFLPTIGRIEHGWRVRPDLCAVDNARNPRDYLGKFWIDSILHDPAMLEHYVKLIGEDKIALGTDYPFPLGEWFPEDGWQPGRLIESMPWPAERKTKLLGLNALDWLHMEASYFH